MKSKKTLYDSPSFYDFSITGFIRSVAGTPQPPNAHKQCSNSALSNSPVRQLLFNFGPTRLLSANCPSGHYAADAAAAATVAATAAALVAAASSIVDAVRSLH